MHKVTVATLHKAFTFMYVLAIVREAEPTVWKGYTTHHMHGDTRRFHLRVRA